VGASVTGASVKGVFDTQSFHPDFVWDESDVQRITEFALNWPVDPTAMMLLLEVERPGSP